MSETSRPARRPSASARTSGRPHCRLQGDDGVGIPPPDRERLLGQTVDLASTRVGLGLRIVARIVDAHGWAVRITEGSTGGGRFEVTGVVWC